jgi:hypothetical protein
VISPKTVDGPASLQLPQHDRRRSHYKPYLIKAWDVYVGGFIGMIQGSATDRHHTKHVLLTLLDYVLMRLDSDDSAHQQEPASVKTMLKGNTTWATIKVILGWLLYTPAMPIQLPSHRVLRLFELLDSIAPSQ